MNCYLHPQTEGVTTCGKCGVAMCKECETNAFFRLDGGKGQALCNRCSLIEAQENVDYESSWLKKRLVKLIICSIFVISGLFFLLALCFSGYIGSGVFLAVILWAISGAIANIGIKENNESVKDQVSSAVFEYDHPFMNMIIKIFVNAILGPFLLISHIISYIKTKNQYKKDIQVLEELKAALNQ